MLPLQTYLKNAINSLWPFPCSYYRKINYEGLDLIIICIKDQYEQEGYMFYWKHHGFTSFKSIATALHRTYVQENQQARKLCIMYCRWHVKLCQGPLTNQNDPPLLQTWLRACGLHLNYIWTYISLSCNFPYLYSLVRRFLFICWYYIAHCIYIYSVPNYKIIVIAGCCHLSSVMEVALHWRTPGQILTGQPLLSPEAHLLAEEANKTNDIILVNCLLPN